MIKRSVALVGVFVSLIAFVWLFGARASGVVADAPAAALPTSTPTPPPSVTYTVHFPLVFRDYFPPTWFEVFPSSPTWHILATGDVLTDALTGNEIVEVRENWHDKLWAANIGPWPGVRDKTNVARSYFAFDLSELPDVPNGKVLSATLELYTDMLSSINGDFLLRFHRSQWQSPLTGADWSTFESEPLGVYDTRLWEGPGLDKPIWVPLPGLVGQPVPKELKLVFRGDEETILGPWEDLTASIALRWRYEEDIPWVSKLHVLIGAE